MEQVKNDQPERKHFAVRVWQTVAIIAFVVVLLWLLKATVQILLLVLTAALVAVFFQRFAGLIERKTGWNHKASLAISVFGTLVLIVLVFWFIGARVQDQIAQLTNELPSLVQNAKTQISKSPLGATLMERAGSGSKAAKKLIPVAQQFFTTSFGVLGDLYAILFLGIFFTISPKTYVNGFLKLFPTKAKGEARHVINKVGTTLGDWLKGQLFAMLVVAVLTGIGLTILGVPLVLALALIAGILNFVPNIGPLIAMVPAVLVSLTSGGNMALWVIGLYLLVQGLESNLITPYIQNKMISIPPALILMGQLIIGSLLGVMGIILATPIVAMLMVIVQELYVKKQAPEPVHASDDKHKK